MNEEKKRIFDVVRKQWAENSMSKITVSDICRKTGISKYNFYKLYSNKYALLLDLVRYEIINLKKEAFKAVDFSESPHNRLLGIFNNLFNLVKNDVLLNRMCMEYPAIIQELPPEYTKQMHSKLLESLRDSLDAINIPVSGDLTLLVYVMRILLQVDLRDCDEEVSRGIKLVLLSQACEQIVSGCK